MPSATLLKTYAKEALWLTCAIAQALLQRVYDRVLRFFYASERRIPLTRAELERPNTLAQLLGTTVKRNTPRQPKATTQRRQRAGRGRRRHEPLLARRRRDAPVLQAAGPDALRVLVFGHLWRLRQRSPVLQYENRRAFTFICEGVRGGDEAGPLRAVLGRCRRKRRDVPGHRHAARWRRRSRPCLRRWRRCTRPAGAGRRAASGLMRFRRKSSAAKRRDHRSFD